MVYDVCILDDAKTTVDVLASLTRRTAFGAVNRYAQPLNLIDFKGQFKGSKRMLQSRTVVLQ
jgi:hypothetical protein